jgi:hypothetical protein
MQLLSDTPIIAELTVAVVCDCASTQTDNGFDAQGHREHGIFCMLSFLTEDVEWGAFTRMSFVTAEW